LAFAPSACRRLADEAHERVRRGMGRKKASQSQTQQQTKPFCFFCDRSFEDETVLVQHQRAKHFRCPECDDGAIRGKCESVQGLIVHTLKVHGKTLSRVPNALQGRDNPELNVYGMDGIPEEVLRQKGYVSAASDPPRGAGRGGVAPAPEQTHVAMPHPPPSIPPMPGSAMAGMHHDMMSGMHPPSFMQPGMAGMPGAGPPGVPQDFLDFLGQQAGPPPASMGMHFPGAGLPGGMPDFARMGQGGAPMPPLGGSGCGSPPAMEAQQLPASPPQWAPPPSHGSPVQAGVGAPAAQVAASLGLARPPPPPPKNGSFAPPPPSGAALGEKMGMMEGGFQPIEPHQASKRPLEEDAQDENGEDLSVEEKRAQLSRYAFPK